LQIRKYYKKEGGVSVAHIADDIQKQNISSAIYIIQGQITPKTWQISQFSILQKWAMF
jgi:hypothetical protein